MRLFTVLTFLVLFIPFSSSAQKWAFGLFAGGANYNGELSAEDEVVLGETNPSFGFLARHNFSEYFTAKGSLTYGRISGDDANNDSRSRQILRNASFRSDIFEASLQAELNIFGFDPTDRDNRTALYLLGGISVYHFNPEARYQGEWVELQPLGTEGQGTSVFPNREKYSLTQIAFPVGGGIKHAFNKNWSLGFEFGSRKTLTDYLDDVSRSYAPEGVFDLSTSKGQRAYRLSNRTWETLDEAKSYDENDQRGNPSTDDWYMFGGFTLTYTIADPSCQTF